MKLLRELSGYRDAEWERRTAGGCGDDFGGCFKVPSVTDRSNLAIIASSGLGWDHVSVSHSRRCPNWPEMEAIKHLFFHDDETAMQLHVPPSEHVNYHPYCLHLWRPHAAEIPRPPSIMVGPRTKKVA